MLYYTVAGLHILVAIAAIHLRLHNGGIYNSYSVGQNVTSTLTLLDIIPEKILRTDLGLAFYVLATLIILMYGFALVYVMWRICFARMDYAANKADRIEEVQVGHLITPGLTKREVANKMRKMRKCGKIPPVYPNGWYEVMLSEELPVGAVKAVSMIGQQLAVFRGENGAVSVMDAYCPHLGAHLGVGGQVRGNCIECPFHGWQYDGETGQCTKIPYSEKVPSFIKVKVWPTSECNGIIYLWFDAEGREPSYLLKQFEEIKNGQWVYRGRTTHYIPCHIEEIPENGGDVMHLNHLHHHSVSAGWGIDFANSILGRIGDHIAESPKWVPQSAPNSHVSCLTMKMNNIVMGYNVLQFDVTAKQIGPSVVYLLMRLPIGNVLIIQSVVPEKPLLQRFINHVYGDWWMPALIPKIFLKGECMQINRDIMVWSNKTFVSKPALVKEDHQLSAHRRWYSQFYSEHSPRLNSHKSHDNDDDSLTW